jgi:predicted ATPase
VFISHIKLKNWRNFQNINIELGERIFLVGPNASGKSNFLDAIRFLRDIVKPGGGLQKAVSDRGGVSKIRCLAARKYPDIEIEIEISENEKNNQKWKYAIGIRQEARGYRSPYLSYEKVFKNNNEILNRPNEDDKKDQVRLTQTNLEQINANKDFREIYKFLDSILYIHLVPQLLRHPEAFSGPNIQEDPYGRNFLERIAKTPEKTRKSRLKKIEFALKVAVPQLEKLSATKDEIGIPHLEAVYEHWRPEGARQREDQFSDGTLRLIGFLWSLLESNSLLLMEEPELSLNSGIIKKIPALISRIQRQRKNQVIISTHSADLLSDRGIGGEEVLILKPVSEGTHIQVASSNKEIKNLLENGFSIAEAALPYVMPDGIEQLGLFK